MVAFYKRMELKSIKYCIIIVYYVNVLSGGYKRYVKVDVILNVEIWSKSLKKKCQSVKTIKMQDLLSLKRNSVPITSTFPLYHM